MGSDPSDVPEGAEWPPSYMFEPGVDPNAFIVDGVRGGKKPRKTKGKRRAKRKPVHRTTSASSKASTAKNPPVGSDPVRSTTGSDPIRRAGSDPTDRNLRYFVAAVRAGSFTHAAKHLGVGQPAVSVSIRALERQHGLELVRRSRTGITTTAKGQLLFDAIAPAFDHIDLAVKSLQRSDAGTVSLSVSTSLASWWLLPRLPDFKRTHPEVSLRLVTADSDAGVDANAFDLWVPLGRIDDARLQSTDLCREALLPVASPELAASIGSDPSALLTAPLLHLEERYTPRFDWKQWFTANGIDTPGSLPGDRSTDYSLVVQAALDGQGVALGWEHIVRDLVDDGRLVSLGEPIVTQSPFVVLNPANRPLSPDALALRTWLIDQLAV